MGGITLGNRSELAATLLSSMHQLRHDVFVRRLGWNLQSTNDTEQDQYDRDDAVYLMQRNAEGRLTGCARLLPTTRPYMLPELFPQLLGDTQPPCDPAVWEMSRFAANARDAQATRVLMLSKPTLQLLDCVLAFGHANAIKRILLVTSLAIERLLLRVSLDVRRLAAPAAIDDAQCVALAIEVPRAGAVS